MLRFIFADIKILGESSALCDCHTTRSTILHPKPTSSAPLFSELSFSLLPSRSSNRSAVDRLSRFSYALSIQDARSKISHRRGRVLSNRPLNKFRKFYRKSDRACKVCSLNVVSRRKERSDRMKGYKRTRETKRIIVQLRNWTMTLDLAASLGLRKLNEDQGESFNLRE